MGLFWKTNAFEFSLFVLFCSCFYVYFMCPTPTPCPQGELLPGMEDKISSGSDVERLTSREGASCGAGPLPLEDICVVIGQVTAADELRDLNGFRNH